LKIFQQEFARTINYNTGITIIGVVSVLSQNKCVYCCDTCYILSTRYRICTIKPNFNTVFLTYLHICIQHMCLLYAIRTINYNTEQEANRFLKRKTFDNASRFQVCIMCIGVVSVVSQYNCVYYCDTCYQREAIS
jgi:hypothetical protein